MTVEVKNNTDHIDYDEAKKIRRLLWKWGNVPYYVRQKEREIKEYLFAVEDAYNTLKGIREYGVGGSGSGPSSAVENAIEAAEHRREQYQNSAEKLGQSIEQALRLKEVIDELLEEFDELTQKVVRMRYVDNRRWEYIAMRLCIDERHARRLEKGVVKKMSGNVRFSVLG